MTPPDAVVQIDPYPRGFTWVYIPAFAERRMAAGLPISMVPLEKYEAASQQLKTVFIAETAMTAHQRALAEGVDYLYIGQPEREANPKFEDLIKERPDLFQPVFRNSTISIYFVERAAADQPRE
jgi:hypothetical protein